MYVHVHETKHGRQIDKTVLIFRMFTDNDNSEPCVEKYFASYIYYFLNEEPTYSSLCLKETGFQILFLP